GAASVTRLTAAKPEPEAIDLIDLAGGGALKKYAPAVLGAVVLAVVLVIMGRLRAARKARHANG
ncbi:MAG: hypothetical protein M3Y83_11880, partial [Actinomycetota bacterium]|nr:hypothetical protein [Actinomycetota bacterium]